MIEANELTFDIFYLSSAFKNWKTLTRVETISWSLNHKDAIKR